VRQRQAQGSAEKAALSPVNQRGVLNICTDLLKNQLSLQLEKSFFF
jgi:hypothetical protein